MEQACAQPINRPFNARTQQIVDAWFRAQFDPEFVKIDTAQMFVVANEMAEQRFGIPDWRMPNVLPENHQAFLSHLVYSTAINFGFTEINKPHRRFRITDETGVHFGSQAMCRCLYRHFGEKPIPAERMAAIVSSEAYSRWIFRGDTPMPMLPQRRALLRETAHTMLEKFDDEPENILRSGNWLATSNNLNILSVLDVLENDFPKTFGLDRSYLRDDLQHSWPLPFSKRAQLFLMIYQGRASHSNSALPLLANGDLVGPISDSAVPNALRSLKILEYSPDLQKMIDEQVELPSGSRQELEIRMATVVAMKMMLEAVNAERAAANRPKITLLELDNLLWRMGRNEKTPCHLTRTTAY